MLWGCGNLERCRTPLAGMRKDREGIKKGQTEEMHPLLFAFISHPNVSVFGKNQWLNCKIGGRGMASTGARAYNGGLGAEPPAGFRGRAPGRGVRG